MPGNSNLFYFWWPQVKKNPLNGWGKGINIQVDLCFDANSAPRNSILTMVYKGQSSRSKGHRAGVTLQIKWRDLWNLIADKVHLYFTHTTYMIKTFTGAKVGGGGDRVSNFPTSTLGRLLLVPLCNVWPLFLDSGFFFISGLPVVIPFS